VNFRQLAENNKVHPVRLRPETIRRTADGQLLPFIDDDWTLSQGEGKNIGLHNRRTGHSFTLGSDNVREFRTPNFLLLNCRLTLQDTRVLIEPFIWNGKR
jgi:hypothetical protein